MGRPRKAEQPDQPKNGPDPETIASYFRKLETSMDDEAEAKIPYDSARGRTRSLKKAAKTDGVDVDALMWTIRARRRDRSDVEREMANKIRYAKLMSLPLGAQLDMFGEGPTASVADSNARYDARREGVKAGRRGENRTDGNPHPAGSDRYVCWDDGWVEGQGSIVETLSPQPSHDPRHSNGGESAVQ